MKLGLIGAGRIGQLHAELLTYHVPGAAIKTAAEINLAGRAQALGLEMRSGLIVVPFFGRPHFISRQGVVDADGNPPTPAVATVLLNYTLRNANIHPPNPEIISFRDFSGAGPLVVSFANNTNHLIASTFAGRLDALEAARQGPGRRLGSRPRPQTCSCNFRHCPACPSS